MEHETEQVAKTAGREGARETSEIKDIAKEAGKEGAREILRILAIDVDNVRETQTDFIFLRNTRRNINYVKKSLLVAALITSITAAGSYVWLAF